MSILSGLKVPETAEKVTNNLGGGFTPMSSDVYSSTVKVAYLNKAASGAMAVVVEFVTKDKKTVTSTQWVQSGDAKGNKTTYTDKSDPNKEHPLPGMAFINNLLKLTLDKTLDQMDTDKKYVKVYGEDKEVDTLKGIEGEEILIGVKHNILNKQVKNQITGKYEDTNETRAENEVTDVFRVSDKLTVPEIEAGVTNPVFHDAWIARWQGVVNDKSTVKGGASAGAPGAPKQTQKLFNKPADE